MRTISSAVERDNTKLFHSGIQTKAHLQGICDTNVGLISAVRALTQQKTIFHLDLADDHLCLFYKIGWGGVGRCA